MANRKENEQRLIAKACVDKAFRKALVANPKAVLEKEIGADLPDDLKVHVIEENEKNLGLVLPPMVPSEELTEEQLAAVAGGGLPEDLSWLFNQITRGAESIVRYIKGGW